MLKMREHTIQIQPSPLRLYLCSVISKMDIPSNEVEREGVLVNSNDSGKLDDTLAFSHALLLPGWSLCWHWHVACGMCNGQRHPSHHTLPHSDVLKKFIRGSYWSWMVLCHYLYNPAFHSDSWTDLENMVGVLLQSLMIIMIYDL